MTARNPAEEGFKLAVDGNSVWVAVQHTGVARVDWACGKVASRFTRPPGAGYYDLIAAGGGAALTHGEEDADQLDPRTGKATAIQLGGLPTGAAFAAGSFWVSVDNATLARIDQAITVDTTELWEVTNRSGNPRNFHVHDVQFQLVDYAGRPPRRTWPGGRTGSSAGHHRPVPGAAQRLHRPGRAVHVPLDSRLLVMKRGE